MRTHGGSFHIFVILLRECTMLKAVVRPNYKLLLSIRIQLTSERATSQKLNATHTWVYGGFTAPGRRWHQLNGATAYAAHTERVGYVGCGVCTVHCMSWPCGLRSPMRRDGPVPLPVLGPRLLAEDLAETQRRRPS